MRADVIHGDCLDVLRGMDAGTFDAVVTDPPYPCIKRSYGYWTEAEWFALMNPVVEECRRVLKPSGSAVFILQPNSEKVGRMRTWLWRFMADWGERWGIVQDAWWWNIAAVPVTNNRPGLMRPSLKACVWFGGPDCYRDELAVLWTESDGSKAHRLSGRCTDRLQQRSSGVVMRDDRARTACTTRGGVNPFNVLPMAGGRPINGHEHSAATPFALARWWVRYICPPDGRVLDPFGGIGTSAVAALKEGRSALLIEREAAYVDIARRRIAEAEAELFAETPA